MGYTKKILKYTGYVGVIVFIVGLLGHVFTHDHSEHVHKEYAESKDVLEETMSSKLRSIFQEHRKSIVRIKTEVRGHYRFTGTGWFIKKDLVVTNAHVTRGQTDIRVVIADEYEVDAKVLAEDFKGDLALAQTNLPEGYESKPLEINYKPLEKYERVVFFGLPYKQPYFDLGTYIRKGEVAWPRIGIKKHDTLIVKMTSGPGASGSPVFNQNGEVIGVLEGGYRRIDLTILTPAKYLKDLMDRMGSKSLMEEIRRLKKKLERTKGRMRKVEDEVKHKERKGAK